MVQQAYGTHTEGGTQFAAPLVMEPTARGTGGRYSGGGFGGSYGTSLTLPSNSCPYWLLTFDLILILDIHYPYNYW